MLDADAVINNSSQKVGGSNAYPDPAPKKWVCPDPEKHIRSTPLPLSPKRLFFMGILQADMCNSGLHIMLLIAMRPINAIYCHVPRTQRIVHSLYVMLE